MTDVASDVSRLGGEHSTWSASFENPTAGAGSGGRAGGGRKGAAFGSLEAGQRAAIVDVEGPGVVRHIWMTVPPGPPELLRAIRLEVFYDDLQEPSISVPLLDFFGLAHGRLIAYASEMTSVAEGHGLNSYLPMPFRQRIRIEVANETQELLILFFQVDGTSGPVDESAGLLHCVFRRENPTTLGRDFVIHDEGLVGPGRYVGTVLGVRVLDEGDWYGEGEVKFFIDGDTDLPSICGTGLEDYIGSGWGLGQHSHPYGGAPLVIPDPDSPTFVSAYRWHARDPIFFNRTLRATVQQVGAAYFGEDEVGRYEDLKSRRVAASFGWKDAPGPGFAGGGIFERVDDFCATSFVYVAEAQPVRAYPAEAATADLARLAVEEADPAEVVRHLADAHRRPIEGASPLRT